MRHTSWNDGWQFSLQGGAPVPVQLPHDFSFALPREPRNPSGMDGGWFAGGIGEYTKTFSRPEEERCALLIDGAQGLSEVWINGNRAAFHPYGYSPFVADLAPFLREGENALRVVCNTQMRALARGQQRDRNAPGSGAGPRGIRLGPARQPAMDSGNALPVAL